MRRVLLILLLFPTIWSACEGTTTFYVPAVSGEHGGFVQTKIAVGEGNSTFFEIPPYIGITTQNSFITGIKLAEKLAGKECSFAISFPEKEVENVDGPSGGLMFTIYAYSLLANMTPREDAVATGSVDENGRVGRVGGVYEKAAVSKKMGKRYFVAPNPSISEYMLAKELEDENFSVIYIENVEEAIDFMFSNITPKGIRLKRTENIPEENSPWKVDGFDGIAEEMIDKEETGLNDPSIPEEVYDYVQESIALQKGLLKKGYQYGAANDAFTVLIDMRTLKDISSKTLEEKAVEVEGCLNRTELEEKREDNWEWIVGAEVRKKWAEKEVKKAMAAEPELEEERYVLMNKLEYAYGWCEIAQQLNKKGEGKILNESVYKERAEALISKVEKEIATGEALDHLDNAKELYDEGKYLASGYEALFAESINDARIGKKSEVRTYKTMWGKLYGSQAKFSGQTEVINLANNLEEFFTEAEEDAVWVKGSEQENPGTECAAATAILVILAATAVATCCKK